VWGEQIGPASSFKHSPAESSFASSIEGRKASNVMLFDEILVNCGNVESAARSRYDAEYVGRNVCCSHQKVCWPVDPTLISTLFLKRRRGGEQEA